LGELRLNMAAAAEWLPSLAASVGLQRNALSPLRQMPADDLPARHKPSEDTGPLLNRGQP